jgi:hypothetical protein
MMAAPGIGVVTVATGMAIIMAIRMTVATAITATMAAMTMATTTIIDR